MNWTELQFANPSVNSPTEIHLSGSKRPGFSAAPVANAYEVGHDANARDQ